MIKIILISFLSFSCIFANSTQDLLQKASVAPISPNADTIIINAKPSTYYEPTSKGGYLGLSVGLIFTGSLLAAGLLYLMPESVTKWNKAEAGDLFTKWKTKTRKGPVVDNDELWLNYIAHPYFGALFYLQPRTAGFSWESSVMFSFLASTFFWEYGIEGFAEVPSWQDIIITPAIGSILGEGFYRLIRYIQMNNNELFGQWWLGKTMIWILDPLGSLIYSTGLGELFGIYNKNNPKSPEIISTPILPNGKGGVSLNLIIRF
ncbi:hypothetical protein CCY99_08610 [Helicobacter sp. 16-1353]|uniref:DUF3943 domain-containing protein n=1 Tax=Helicobacter sp. 16-1353 TaxID=2004996 RepID=UPI000DCDCA1D|nr:DUF3943 domain-containing protein [Helicobacter sp. 16-1353]RAX51725.1 hypothetical protein CCY99_08610 [Helicobacter sp. 16-1353]